jgi:uncharacterized phage-associated protein
MATALDVAQYFIAVAPEEEGITHLKLEKLVAYAQAMSLAMLDRPLFTEEIEAWDQGPVIPSVYDEFKGNGKSPIPAKLSEQNARENFDDEQKFILEAVNAYYGELQASALRDRSRIDFPGPFGTGMPIAQSEIKKAFRTNELVVRLEKAFAELDSLTRDFAAGLKAGACKSPSADQGKR